MACQIHLRRKQSKRDIESSESPNVCIYAPSWVSEGLATIGKAVKNVAFAVVHGRSTLESFTLNGDPLSLVQLHKITMIDPRNKGGRISTDNYKGLIDNKIIYALRDLVRQCVIVGVDETTHYGGFPKKFNKIVPQQGPVYVCNLIGLQFQQEYNSGRLVLYSSNYHEGALDDLIFRNVTGEPRKTFAEVKEVVESADSKRYKKQGTVYFDTVAYSKFVAKDVVLTGLAINDMASQRGHLIHFKFLRYGTGFFGGVYKKLLVQLILPAVVDGLEMLFKEHQPEQIRSLEFPFYTPDSLSKKRLDALCKEFKLQYKFSKDDALKQTAPDKFFIVATTNCADPHAVTGNEMNWGSVDSAIAENIKSKGNIFSTCLNKAMKEELLQF